MKSHIKPGTHYQLIQITMAVPMQEFTEALAEKSPSESVEDFMTRTFNDGNGNDGIPVDVRLKHSMVADEHTTRKELLGL